MQTYLIIKHIFNYSLQCTTTAMAHTKKQSETASFIFNLALLSLFLPFLVFGLGFPRFWEVCKTIFIILKPDVDLFDFLRHNLENYLWMNDHKNVLTLQFHGRATLRALKNAFYVFRLQNHNIFIYVFHGSVGSYDTFIVISCSIDLKLSK